MSSIHLEGDTKNLLSKMKKLSDIDRKSINKVLGESIRTSTIERFKTEKNPDGGAWKKSLRVTHNGGKTLTKSASLRTSIHVTAGQYGFAVGTNKIYAATHQYGAKNRKIVIKAKTSKGLIFKIGDRWIRKKQVQVNVNIPARPFLGINDEDMKEIKATIEDALMED